MQFLTLNNFDDNCSAVISIFIGGRNDTNIKYEDGIMEVTVNGGKKMLPEKMPRKLYQHCIGKISDTEAIMTGGGG